MIYAFVAGIFFGAMPPLGDIAHLPVAVMHAAIAALLLAYARRPE